MTESTIELYLKKSSDYKIEALTFQLTHFMGQCPIIANLPINYFISFSTYIIELK